MQPVVKEFFEASLQEQENKNKGLQVYQHLVLHRFVDLLSNSFPLFYELVEEKEFHFLVYKFMNFGAKELFIWKTPKEFMQFVKQQKLCHKQKYLYDVLLFEWVEIELMMKDYSLQEKTTFSWNNHYKKPKNVKLFKTNYDVINRDFSTKQKQLSLAYFDIESCEVSYMPVHIAFYKFVQSINATKTLQEHLENFCAKNELNEKDAKEFLQNGLERVLWKYC